MSPVVRIVPMKRSSDGCVYIESSITKNGNRHDVRRIHISAFANHAVWDPTQNWANSQLDISDSSFRVSQLWANFNEELEPQARRVGPERLEDMRTRRQDDLSNSISSSLSLNIQTLGCWRSGSRLHSSNKISLLKSKCLPNLLSTNPHSHPRIQHSLHKQLRKSPPPLETPLATVPRKAFPILWWPICNWKNGPRYSPEDTLCIYIFPRFPVFFSTRMFSGRDTIRIC